MQTIKNLKHATSFFRLNYPSKVIGAIERNSVLIRSLKTNKLYLLQFKREVYNHFRKHFRNIKLGNPSLGYGQIMSESILEKAIKKDVEKLIFIMPNGTIYSCYPMQFKRFVEEYNTRVPHIKGEVAMSLDCFETLSESDKI